MIQDAMYRMTINKKIIRDYKIKLKSYLVKIQYAGEYDKDKLGVRNKLTKKKNTSIYLYYIQIINIKELMAQEPKIDYTILGLHIILA